jgi:hypothetical protein
MGSFLRALRSSSWLDARTLVTAIALLAAVTVPALASATSRNPSPVPEVYDADADHLVTRAVSTSGATAAAGDVAMVAAFIGAVRHVGDRPIVDRAVSVARPRSPPAS